MSGKGKNRGREIFCCFCNSQTSVRCRCLRGKSAAAFSDDRGRSQKEAGCYKPQQCAECVKILQSINNVTAMHLSPVSLYNGITASLVRFTQCSYTYCCKLLLICTKMHYIYLPYINKGFFCQRGSDLIFCDIKNDYYMLG